VDLPKLGRNPFMMSKLAQNVTPVGDPHFNRMQDQSGSSQISIAGGPVRGNQLPAGRNSDHRRRHRAIIIPTLGSRGTGEGGSPTPTTRKWRDRRRYVQYVPEIGHQRLARQPVRHHAANQFGTPTTTSTTRAGIPLPISRTVLWRQLRRAVAGSQTVQRPERTFFWLAWEGYQDTQSNTKQFTTPTALERIGDFSQSRTAGGAAQRNLRSEEHGLRRQHLHPAAVRRQRDSRPAA